MKSLMSISPAAQRLAAILAGAALVSGGGGAMLPAASGASPAHPNSGWVVTWAASPMQGTALESSMAHAGFSNQTVRNIVYTSVGGDELRVRVSNTFGTTSLKVGDVRVGVVLDGARLVSGSARTVTFAGKASVTIPAGAQVLSDPLAMRVMPLQELAVSLYLPKSTGPATNHGDAQQTGYVASGDHAGDTAGSAYTTTDSSWFFLDGLDVRNYGTAKGEALREAVNTWIRTSHAFDGVIDFARATQDLNDPTYLNPAYNSFNTAASSYDNLHPNDLGYEVMAHAINLALMR